MERRGFLKLLGLGAVTAAVAATVGVDAAQAAPAAPAEAPAASADAFLDQLTEANKGDGSFAQYYYRRPRYYARPRYRVRPRYYRPRYYYRPRRCGWYRTYYGRVWRCV